jgi:hypothetical protein
MTQPTGGYRRACYLQCYEDPIGRAAKSLCMNADTVTTGFLCDESAVISNACRSPHNAVDAFVCDDRRMAEVQAGLWDATKEIVKTIFAVLVGRMP